MSHDQILNALGDSTRRAILRMIGMKARSVGEIAHQLPVSQPAVSQHLRILKEAGLVHVERAGRRRIYHIESKGFEPLHRYVASFWDAPLIAFQESFSTADSRQASTHGGPND